MKLMTFVVVKTINDCLHTIFVYEFLFDVSHTTHKMRFKKIVKNLAMVYGGKLILT